MNLCEFALGAEGHFPVLSPHPSEIPETFYQNSTILVWSTTQEISRFFSAISREFPGFPVLSGLKKNKKLIRTGGFFALWNMGGTWPYQTGGFFDLWNMGGTWPSMQLQSRAGQRCNALNTCIRSAFSAQFWSCMQAALRRGSVDDCF